jgi:hypothetical protein
LPQSLLSSPLPLTAAQRTVFALTALAVAGTRVFALSETLWDWDEAQFASGVRDFNVGSPYHHPHPPGFPVYMALAKLARLVIPSDFAALQTIVFLAACALFPLGFLLARELRFPFATSAGAPLLFVFLPNVWFYGGTGFSDIPALAFTLAAAAMLLRGCRSLRDYLLGALLLGLAAGMRPQALMLGAAPLAIASWYQYRASWRRVPGALSILGATILVCYGGAALASGSVERYIVAVRDVGEWVRSTDAVTNPDRPSLGRLFDEYFVRPMGGGRLGIVVSALALLGALRGLVRREGPLVGPALLTFLPFAFFAYLSLDYHSIHRYSTAYLFLWTLLAAHALAPFWRWPVAGQLALIVLMTARYAQWTAIMLREVRDTPAPTHAALTWVREHVAKGERVWVQKPLEGLARYYLNEHDVHFTNDEEQVRRNGRAGEYYAIEGGMLGQGNHMFLRPHGRIWDVARQRYFAVAVVPISNLWQFREGWHDEEHFEKESWRWMSTRGEIVIPPGPGRARVRVMLAAQDRLQPLVEVELNGEVIDRFTLPPRATRKEWVVTSRADAPNRLIFRSSETMNPKADGVSDDARDLSLRLMSYSWLPLR